MQLWGGGLQIVLTFPSKSIPLPPSFLVPAFPTASSHLEQPLRQWLQDARLALSARHFRVGHPGFARTGHLEVKRHLRSYERTYSLLIVTIPPNSTDRDGALRRREGLRQRNGEVAQGLTRRQLPTRPGLQ